MQQQNIPIVTLNDMYKRGEMRLPEIQRYRDFLQYRRTALADRMNNFIKEKAAL